MKVKCNKIVSPEGIYLDCSTSWLKIGKEYLVLAISLSKPLGMQIYIQTEHHNEPVFFGVGGFEFIDQNMPSLWVANVSNTEDRKIMTLLPESWNYSDFFEDMKKKDSKAINLFNQAAEHIYREANVNYIPKLYCI